MRLKITKSIFFEINIFISINILTCKLFIIKIKYLNKISIDRFLLIKKFGI